MTTSGNVFNKLIKPEEILIKGNLIKKNWYGAKQLRYFELQRDGQLKYYEDMNKYKGTIKLGQDSLARKIAKNSISMKCEFKKKDYILMQPESGQIDFQKEQKNGHNWYIDEWLQQMNLIVDNLKRNSIHQNALSNEPFEDLDKQ